MLIVKGSSARVNAEQNPRPTITQIYGHTGYAVPRRPIRVVLARDEEAAGIESEETKIDPPAYGVWRQSVVCYL
jgi:hypothetical protein